LEAAERRFREALDLAPAYVEAMSNLGWVEAARGNQAGAETWYERAIAADPTYPHVYRRLADLYYDRKDWARALEYYRRVLRVLPQHFEVLIQAGNSARFLGDVPAAVAHYAAAGEARSDSWIPPYNLACLRAVNGEPQPALALLGEAVNRGFASTTLLAQNEDLDMLRGGPGWAELVARTQAVAARKPPSGQVYRTPQVR
jgi:tetratricopeptide (TPR) repeat protein